MKHGRTLRSYPKLDSALLRETTIGNPDDRIDVLVDVGDSILAVPPEIGSCYAHDARAWTAALGRRPRVVTGTVRRADILTCLSSEYVVRAQAAFPVYGQMRRSVPEIGLTPDRAGRPEGVTGAGVMIGIVDDGCDWAHRNFRDAAGRTRVAFLWDQTPADRLDRHRQEDPPPPGLFGYGREFNAARLDAALFDGSSDEAYRRAGYALEPGAHGTAVMDVAAGNGSAHPRMAAGVAHEATLVFVQLPRDVVDRTDRLGHSRYVLDAVHYIFAKAREFDLPAVVNLSLGGTHGPHDGTTLLETALDDLLDPRRSNGKARAIVVAAGNAGESRLHATRRLAGKSQAELAWRIAIADPTANHLEIWHRPEPKLTVRLRAPDKKILLEPFAHDHGTAIEHDGQEIGWVCRRSLDPGNGMSQTHVALATGAPSGDWTVILENGADHTLDVDAWITRDDRGAFAGGQQSRFAPGQRDWIFDDCTVSTPASARRVIAVGGYSIRSRGPVREGYSGAGRTRDAAGRTKPECYAPLSVFADDPDHGIACASARDSGWRLASGTSIAAPHITGLIALLLQQHPSMSVDEIRERLNASYARATDQDLRRPRWPL